MPEAPAMRGLLTGVKGGLLCYAISYCIIVVLHDMLCYTILYYMIMSCYIVYIIMPRHGGTRGGVAAAPLPRFHWEPRRRIGASVSGPEIGKLKWVS